MENASQNPGSTVNNNHVGYQEALQNIQNAATQAVPASTAQPPNDQGILHENISDLYQRIKTLEQKFEGLYSGGALAQSDHSRQQSTQVGSTVHNQGAEIEDHITNFFHHAKASVDNGLEQLPETFHDDLDDVLGRLFHHKATIKQDYAVKMQHLNNLSVQFHDLRQKAQSKPRAPQGGLGHT